MFSYYLSLEKSREKIMCSKKTKWEKFASCEIFWIEQILARKEEEIDDTPCTYNFQSAIEKLNECKKINQVLSKTLPFNSAPFKKVYKSSVQSLLLLIKHQKKKTFGVLAFENWKIMIKISTLLKLVKIPLQKRPNWTKHNLKKTNLSLLWCV